MALQVCNRVKKIPAVDNIDASSVSCCSTINHSKFIHCRTSRMRLGDARRINACHTSNFARVVNHGPLFRYYSTTEKLAV